MDSGPVAAFLRAQLFSHLLGMALVTKKMFALGCHIRKPYRYFRPVLPLHVHVSFGQLMGEELALAPCGLMAGLMAKLVVNEQHRNALWAIVWRVGGLPSHIHFHRGHRFHDIALIAWFIDQLRQAQRPFQTGEWFHQLLEREDVRQDATARKILQPLKINLTNIGRQIIELRSSSEFVMYDHAPQAGLPKLRVSRKTARNFRGDHIFEFQLRNFELTCR